MNTFTNFAPEPANRGAECCPVGSGAAGRVAVVNLDELQQRCTSSVICEIRLVIDATVPVERPADAWGAPVGSASGRHGTASEDMGYAFPQPLTRVTIVI
jgi:hypothetical protein